MKKDINNLKKEKNKTYFPYLFLILTFLCLITFTNISSFYIVKASSGFFIPAAPDGITSGYTNENYEFTIRTADIGSSWMFNWGDGNNSDWIKVTGSTNYITESHSWDSSGTYEVKVKKIDSYLKESVWSNPLIVKISVFVDSDNDGWSNDIEISYGKNPNDSNDYPLDTDTDGTIDDDSIDGVYIGDLDDDNDLLSDDLELIIGTDPKIKNEFDSFYLSNNNFYIVYSNVDSDNDILYNFQTKSSSSILNENGKLYLDIDCNGAWDYTYQSKILSIYTVPFPWLYLIIGIIAIVLVVLFILIKSGIIYFYEEEVIVRK